MRVETFIPGLRSQLTAQVTQAEAIGYDALVTGEVDNEPFLPLVIAAEHSRQCRVRTGLAIAFSRSPMVVANAGWDLQLFSNGRFELGLGTQVKGHNERRFSVPWSAPAPRMREYVQAVKAIWHTWSTGEPLDYQGEHYRFNLMSPMFTPPPLPCDPPPIYIAGLGPGMARVAGEVADGLLLHPMCSRRYIRELLVPAVAEGAARAGRPASACELMWGGFIACADTPEQLARAKRECAARISFYASTRTYRRALEFHGWEGINEALHRLSLQGKWEEMFDLVDDDMVETLAFCGTPEEVAEQMGRELGDLCTAVMWNKTDHLGTDPSQNDRMAELINRIKTTARANRASS